MYNHLRKKLRREGEMGGKTNENPNLGSSRWNHHMVRNNYTSNMHESSKYNGLKLKIKIRVISIFLSCSKIK